MEHILETITSLIVRGHADSQSPYPPELNGQPGVKERIEEALKQIEPGVIIREGLIPGMELVGQKFSTGEFYLPDMLMSAQAMKNGMEILEPLLAGDESGTLGIVIMGTVKGDMHDIGKNLVGIMLEGGGFKVIDLGIDVSPEKFIEAASKKPQAVIGMSALLTTTRENIRRTIVALRGAELQNKVIVGGAAVGSAFAKEIKADGFTRNVGEVVPMVKRLVTIPE